MEKLQHILENSRKKLLSLEGCTGVGIGYKEVGGDLVDELVIVVFVEKKRGDVRDEFLVPTEIDGVGTDVVERSFGFVETATDPFARFPQLLSGISITPLDVPPAWGSLGCVIQTSGSAQVPAGDYLMTNQHVLKYADPRHPHSTSRVVLQPGNTSDPAPANYNCGDYVHGLKDPQNDCAIADIGYGRTWKNEVPNHPWRPGRRTFAGVAVAQVGDEVYKYGSTTKNTRGVVRYVNFSPAHLSIQDTIYVESPDGTMWVAKGDSGSVLVRYADDYVVGLNFAADEKKMMRPDQHPVLPHEVPAYSAGYSYDIQRQMDVFGGVVTLA